LLLTSGVVMRAALCHMCNIVSVCC